MSDLPEIAELVVPDNIQGTFKRLLRRAPGGIREEPDFRLKLLTFLKLGNETAARQFVAIQKIETFDQLSLIKKHARDVAVPESTSDVDIDEDEKDELDDASGDSAGKTASSAEGKTGIEDEDDESDLPDEGFESDEA